MKRLFPLLIFAVLLVFSGCKPGAQSAPPPSSPGESSSPPVTDEADVLRDVAFTATPIAGGVTQPLDFNENTADKPGYEIDLLPSSGFWAVGGDEWSENYSIVEPGGEGAMLVSLISCPANPVDFFELEGENALSEKLIAYIFTTQDRHIGQQNAVRDFDYNLTVDHTGKREGWQAFHIEFVVPQDEVRSVRFLTANDDISADYTAVSVRIDLPMGASGAYENYMQMLGSIRRK